MRNYNQDFLHLYEEVQNKGREYDKTNPGFLR